MLRQTTEHRFYAWLLKHLILPKCLRMRLIKKVNNILCPKPLDPPTTTAEAEARQRRFEDNIRYIQG